MINNKSIEQNWGCILNVNINYTKFERIRVDNAESVVCKICMNEEVFSQPMQSLMLDYKYIKNNPIFITMWWY